MCDKSDKFIYSISGVIKTGRFTRRTSLQFKSKVREYKKKAKLVYIWCLGWCARVKTRNNYTRPHEQRACTPLYIYIAEKK